MALLDGRPYDDIKQSSLGLVTYRNNAQLDEYNERAERDSGSYVQDSPLVSGLSGHIAACWNANKQAKQPVERQLLKCLRLRKGEYEPEVLAKLKSQGDDNPVFMMIPDIKARAFESWMKELMIPTGEVPFRADPTPVPTLPDEMREFAKAKVVRGLQQKLAMSGMAPQDLGREDMLEVFDQAKQEIMGMMEEQAQEDAENITKEINDQLVEGGWYQALEEMIEDMATYPTAFIEGPTPRTKKVLEWQDGQPAVIDKVVKMYERVSTFDLYPSSGAQTLQDGNLIIKKRFSPLTLQKMIGVEGFDERAIRAVLALYGETGYKEFLSIDSTLDPLLDHHAELSDPEAKIDCLKFWGSVKGSMLLEWGMDESQVPDPDLSYTIIAYKISTYVISARLNPHPLGKRNVYGASFIRQNGSLWGRSPCMVLEDVTRICNSAARAIVRNAGVASGPMGWVVEDRVDPTQRPGEMHPWKLFRFTSNDMMSNSGPPMGFFQPNMVIEQLISLFKTFYDMAGEISGIPAYTHSSDKLGGAGRTASGLSMLFNAAGKVMRGTAIHVDNGIIKPSVEEHWLMIMLFESEKAAGDINIVARASDFLMQIEQMQEAAVDALNVTNNPIDMQIIGLEGRSEVLREYFRRTKLPVDKIVPDRATIVQNTADAKIQEFVQQLAAGLGIEPQKLLEMAQQGAAAQQNGQPGQQQQGQQQQREAA